MQYFMENMVTLICYVIQLSKHLKLSCIVLRFVPFSYKLEEKTQDLIGSRFPYKQVL